MESREEIDPELHLLRSIARSQQNHDIESARFNVFAAFEHGNSTQARRWTGALRVAIVTAGLPAELERQALSAINRIEGAI